LGPLAEKCEGGMVEHLLDGAATRVAATLAWERKEDCDRTTSKRGSSP
jgi:hypothetical protein